MVNMNAVDIRDALDSELDDVLAVERAAFGQDEEAELVKALLHDPSAQPTLSLLAFDNDRAVGHILFTAAHLTPATDTVSVALLAPLAVVPAAQGNGIGGQLIRHGLQRLSALDIGLVFVLGYPDYYSRHGFEPAGCLGFSAPYPIPEVNAAAWMVQALRADLIGQLSGTVVCADALNQPQYWLE